MLDRETLEQLKDSVRRYVREKLVPLEQQVAEEDRIPPGILDDFRQMGLFGLSTPEAYGGLGLVCAEEIEIIIELTWASAAFRSAVGINLGLGSQGILMDGTEAQKDHWLPKIASGEVITSFCLTEPDSGSDSAALRTRAVLDGDSWVIDGSKRYITNAPVAGLFLVMARTHPERLPKNGHVTAFLVPADTPGVTVGPKDKKMGQAGAWSADVYFENVRVPRSAIIGGEPGRGFVTAMKSLDRGRINVASVCVGQARRILHEATQYAVGRTQFGEPLASFQLIQAMLADSQTDLYAAECMLRDVARRYDAGERVSLEASCCKLFCSEMVGRIADRAVQIHGGAGYMRDSAVERFYRDVRLFRIYEGTTQIQQIIIGRELARRAAAS
ncbi:acyl-CoA dehydrogenase family protein [Caballeronia sp. LZ033]|uniref:acyl-CoA dehydrogenase family protein n=1 Tax=Caballeronia sp. LZ033 TaxID=3038566 RepID=UPI00285580F5|nr:acyl-CoA dehydrogenase family protein [Caballeronia sp. LZ033]MDR5815630.1 acyl-CoA dehydrogenase family protein [Caballeronia sp. LZ033]